MGTDQAEPLWALTPQIKAHVYWHRKERFQLDTDIYEHWALFAVESGSFAYGVGGRSGTASFGDLVLCPPHVPFQRKTPGPLSFHYILFDWEKNGRDGREGGYADVPGGAVTVRDGSRLQSDLRLLQDLSGSRDARSSAWKNIILKDMWLLSLADKPGEAGLPEAGAGEDPVAIRAIKRLRAAAYAPFSMKGLAGELGMSPVQFTRLFHSVYGMTPSDYVASLRVERIKELLVDTDWNLNRIAERCGYDNGYYLSRVFSGKVGISPSEYRRYHKV